MAIDYRHMGSTESKQINKVILEITNIDDKLHFIESFLDGYYIYYQHAVHSVFSLDKKHHVLG